MSEFSLTLTTAVKPAEKFTVDGEEYQLLGLDHLSDEQEAEVMALFSRHSILIAQAEATENLIKGREIAKKTKATRILIITKLTDLPAEVAHKLPLGQQAKLLDKLQQVMNADDEDGGTDEGDSE